MTDTPQLDKTAEGGSQRPLVLPLRVGDTLPLHKYSGQNLSMEDLTMRFYHAWAADEEDEMEQLSMNIEETIQQNAESIHPESKP